MQLHGVTVWLLIGAGVAAGCAEPSESGPHVVYARAENAAEPAPDPLTSAIAAYADTHPCEEQECVIHPRLAGTFRSIGGTSERDVWFSMGEKLMHFDGTTVQLHSPGVSSGRIWASAPDDMWFHDANNVVRWDGKSFQIVYTDVRKRNGYRGVWGTSSNDVYLSGFDELVHWDGSSWTQIAEVKGLYMGGTAANDVWVGYSRLSHWDGHSWSHTPLPTSTGGPILSLSVAGPRDVWIVTGNSRGHLSHFDGSDFVLQELGEDIILDQVSALATDDVWAFGRHLALGPVLFHYDGHTWARAPAVPTRLDAVARIGNVDYATGGGRIYRLDKSTLGLTNLTPGTTAKLMSTWGTSSRDMWAVGAEGTALHYDGTRVRSTDTGVVRTLNSVRGTAVDDVWAVGEAGTVVHWDGANWTALPSGTAATLHRVFARERDRAWIVGDGILLQASKSGVTKVVPEGLPANARVIGIDGVAANDVWAVGTMGSAGVLITHYDGKAWSPVQALRHETFNRPAVAIVARGPDDVWIDTRAVQGFPSKYHWHWDGKTWSWVDPFSLAGAGPSAQPPMFPAHDSFTVEGKRWRAGMYGRWSYTR